MIHERKLQNARLSGEKSRKLQLSHCKLIKKSFAHNRQEPWIKIAHNRQELRAKIAHNRQERRLIRFHVLGSFYADLRLNLEFA